MNEEKKVILPLSLGLFLFAFFLYLRTLCPSIYFGDSAELITAVSLLGIPHPTGFPLYLLLGKIFSLFPAGSTAFKINIMSAFFGAAIPALVFLSLYLYFEKEDGKFIRIVVPFTASLLLASSYTLWSQAVIARIYTLNGVMCASMLLFFLLFMRPGSHPKTLYLMGLFTGLGAGLHLSFVIFAAALWFFASVYRFERIRNSLPAIIFFFITGLSVYFYILLRGGPETLLKWMEFNSAGDFWAYITQQQYKGKMFSRDFKGYIYYLGFMKDVLVREFSFAGLIALGAGIIWAYIKKSRFFYALILIFLSNIVILGVYGNYNDLKLAFRYMIPSYIAAAFFISLFFSFFYRTLKNSYTSRYITAGIFALILLLAFSKSYPENDRSKNFIAHFYPADILRTLPDKSYLFVSGDNQVYPIAHYQLVDKKKTGVTIFDFASTIYRDALRLMEESKSKTAVGNVITAFKQGLSPLYTAARIGTSAFSQSEKGFSLLITEKPRPPSFELWKLYPLKGILWDNNMHYTFEEREVVGTYLYRLSLYYEHKGKRDLYTWLLEQAAKKAYDSVPVLGNLALQYTRDSSLPSNTETAGTLFKKALGLNPENPAILFNIGSHYGRLGKTREAAYYFKKVTELDPSNVNAIMYLNRLKKESQRIQVQKAMEQAKDTHFKEAMNLFNSKKYSKALEYFEKDIEQNPGLDRSYFHIALMYSMAKKLDKALPYYEKALERNPKNTATLNNLGLIHYQKYDKEKAKLYFNRSLKINPSQPRIEKLMKEME